MKKIAIVGFGFSGLAFLANFVKIGCKVDVQVDIFDSSRAFPRGLAYSTLDIGHLLNVPAARMSLFEDNPGHFLAWLAEKNPNFNEESFVPRKIYGDYLWDSWSKILGKAASKNIKINFINSIVEQVDIVAAGVKIAGFEYDFAFFAPGNEQKNIPGTIQSNEIDKIHQIQSSTVYIFGMGLTMCDVCITLDKNPNVTKIIAVSRSGKLNAVHDPSVFRIKIPPILGIDDVKGSTMLKILRLFRKRLNESSNWRAAFDSIRPISQELWMAMSLEAKLKFHNKLFGIFSRYRHRIPPEKSEKILKMIRTGKLILQKGDYREFASASEPKINCTGINFNPETIHNPLIKTLLNAKIINNSDIKGFGVKSVTDERFSFISPLLSGEFGEFIAVPELRKHCRNAALNMINSLPLRKF